MPEIKKVCIVGGKRIPFVRSGTHYLGMSVQDLVTAPVKKVVDSYGLKGEIVGEVMLGAVSKHASDFNLAREAVMDSGLSPHTPTTDLQKACGTSLEAAVALANKIALGQIESGIAAGVDTNSEVPIEFKKEFSDRLMKVNYAKTLGQRLAAFKGFWPGELAPKIPSIVEKRTGLSMGEGCEEMAKQWKIKREDQDELAYLSHKNAAAAYDAKFFDDLVFEFKGVKKDTLLRADTSIEKLAKLRPAFDKSEKGTLTAGNSSSLTDGASAVFLCSEEYAKKRGLHVQAYFTTGQSAAVDYTKGEGLLMAPTYAVPQMLTREGLSLQDFDFYEIHEAFAAQVLCTLTAWEDEKFCKEKLGLDKALGSIDRSKLNVKGGSIALGHPFAATGARIVANLAKIIDEKGSGRGLISICTAGGMGVTAIIEK